MRRFFSHLIVNVAFSLLTLSVAYADEAEMFERGKQLYVSGRYEEAREFWVRALEGPTPVLREQSLVIKGRMLRAGSEWYLGNKIETINQFRIILKINPSFEPDPIAFPPGMLDEFRRVREQFQNDAQRNKSCDDLKTVLTKERTECRQLSAQFKSLQKFASEERIVTLNSRWMASLPFGIGQFQNGNFGLGLFFAISESASLLSAVISFAIHERLPSPSDLRFDPERNRSVEVSSRIVNYVSFGTFIGLAITGIVQAHIGYIPEIYETRKRALPKDLQGQRMPIRIEPMVAPMPGGGSLFGIGGTF